MKNIGLTLIILLLTSSLFAQNYFKDYKSGVSYFEKKDYKSAITDFSKVIAVKREHDRALHFRGLSYFKLQNIEKAITDLKNAAEIKPKNTDYSFDLGMAYYTIKKYQKAAEVFNHVIARDKDRLKVYEYIVNSYLSMKEYQKAVDIAAKAVARKKNGKNYFLLGQAQDSLMLFKEAAYSFGRSKFYDAKSIGSHIGLAYSLMQLKDYDKALKSADAALAIDEKNIQALLIRSQINYRKEDLQHAVNDLSKVILIKPNEKQFYAKRAAIYKKLGQHQNAIADLTKYISFDDSDYKIYYNRATSFEALIDYKNAKKDYEKLRILAENNPKAVKLYKEAKKRLFDLNKETNNPKIVMIDPISPKEGIVQIAMNKDKYIIKGQIKDESNITFIKVNGKDASFNKDTLNPYFKIELNLKGIKELNITAFDVYQNSETWVFKILETEVNAPIVKLIAPYASDDGTVYLDSDDPSLYVEGVIKDESLIKNIFIEGATAAYTLKNKNPKFSATINIMNKDGFKVTTEDIYGNKTEKKFILNRENVALLGDNPMGKTWVIFIENSDYKSFASLDGPTKDVTMMKSAFAKYKIHNIVHKKDMTKTQLERFFSIELRDLVRSNKVNSLLIWYAGHGKYINDSGYWIPTDAKRDDEFTYYNINNLKAGMQSYSKYITHTLVVTDACESGPSFYQAMRSTPKDRSCNDWQATKFKSSQVFSSAGYELASDNSQFTKTFANTLSSNPNSCIPIEIVVKKVKVAVSKGGTKQKPKFGKIAGLDDENGTFFFIKK